MPENILNGKNIRLRALEPGDVEVLYAWENDTSVWRVSNTLTPFSKFQLEEYVLSTQNDIYAARQLRLMIVIPGQGVEETPVGTIDLFDFDPFHLRAGIGILIREPFRSKGFALEAMQVLIRYAFVTLRLHQLYCNITPDNEASLHLFGKTGFQKCGLKKDWINDGVKWRDEWMLQLINHDI